MQDRSLNACGDCEIKTLPTFRPSCQRPWQMWLITNHKSPRNFSIVTTTTFFDSASELERSKGCRLSQTFARNTESFQSEIASLASSKKLQHNLSTHSANDGRNSCFLSA